MQNKDIKVLKFCLPEPHKARKGKPAQSLLWVFSVLPHLEDKKLKLDIRWVIDNLLFTKPKSQSPRCITASVFCCLPAIGKDH
jgi:hypothetical protein